MRGLAFFCLSLAPASSSAQDDYESLVQLSSGVRTIPQRSRHGSWRQQLKNTGDLQYTGEILVGQQRLDAILDTGSFEMMVFSESCSTCGQAGAQGFNVSESLTFEQGVLMTVHSFGSGTLETMSGIDRLNVGPYETARQALWIVTAAEMDVLQFASFQAIVGMGPPGQPQREAQGQLAMATAELEKIGTATTALEKERVIVLKDAVAAAQIMLLRNDSLLANLDVTYFSVCFESEPNAPGYWIWNDVAPQRQPDIYSSIRVASETTWEVRMQHAAFEGEEGVVALGCETSCGALLDSGTSLIAVPTDVYNLALTELNKLDTLCTNMASMPDLVFELGGHKYSLPPQAYIGIVEGTVPAHASKWFPRKVTSVRTCELLLMDSGTIQTGLGPMWIIGMPFFRYYYTVFDLGSDPLNASERKIWTATAGDDCLPQGSEVHATNMKHARQQGLRRVNGSHMRGPTRRFQSSSDSDTLSPL